MIDKSLKAPKTKKATPAPIGRPSDYSQSIADTICGRLSDGQSLRSICLEESMPNKATVFRWLASKQEFSDQYARAREEQAETLADEIIGIADDGLNDTYIDDNGNKRTDQDVIARSRLRVEARKWVAAKLKPKKYGEKITQEHTGKDGAPIQTSNVGIDTSKLADSELMTFVALLEKATNSNTTS